MSTTGLEPLQANPAQRGSIFTWIATILACAYIVWTGVMLYMSTPKFVDMYNSMGVELPLSTRIVIATYRFGYPLWFGGATALVIVKQFYMREKWPNLSISLAAVVMVDIISRVIIWALYRPLFDVMEKLNK
jgi:cytosine/uracil/thiamine/allantoin permease